MKFLNINESKDIELVLLGDIHYGSKECMTEELEKTISYVKNNKNARVVLMGDLIDAAMKNSPGAGNFENSFNPQEQLEYVIAVLMPIKDKIYGVLSSNHEDRIFKNAGINVLKMFSSILGIKYLGESTLAKIKVGKQNYSLFATHGATGSTTISGKINTVMKFSTYIDADIYAMGHVHELLYHKAEYFYIDNGTKMIKEGTKHFVLTGHYLKYGGYAEQKGYRPGNTGSPVIKLSSKTHKVQVTCGI